MLPSVPAIGIIANMVAIYLSIELMAGTKSWWFGLYNMAVLFIATISMVKWVGNWLDLP